MRRWCSKMTWAEAERRRLSPSTRTPRARRSATSDSSLSGSTATPFPITLTLPGWRMPEGIRWTTYFSPPTTTVCPALAPPW